MLVGLDAIGELRELGIGQDLGPTSQVEPGLRSEIQKLNADRHARKIHQKRKVVRTPAFNPDQVVRISAKPFYVFQALVQYLETH